jgi:hypothetical protein
VKGDTEVLLLIAFFFAGTALGVALSGGQMEIYLQTLLSSLATVAAAFFGAKYAFQLQERRQVRQTAAERVAAGNRLISALSRTRNKFVAFRRQFISEHRSATGRQFLIQSISGIGGMSIHVNYDSLDFLFDTKEPDFLGRLSMVEQEVISTLELIEQRSHFHFHRLQPIVEALERNQGFPITEEKIDAALGPRDAHLLKSLTDQMVESVDHVIDAIENLASEAYREIKRLYPTHNVALILFPYRNKSKHQDAAN